MGGLSELLHRWVETGAVPGAVALVERSGAGDAGGGAAEVAVAGVADHESAAPMRRDTIFRIASLTKPVVAVATLQAVEDGVLGLDDEVARWLPELAAPVVVRTPSSPVDDVVPAVRPVTVRHLLTFTAGWGFPADFSLPAVQALFGTVHLHGADPATVPDPDTWLQRLGALPMLHQPGEGWLYNLGSDVLGVLLARATGTPLPDLLADRIFGPLAMRDTGFTVPAGSAERFVSQYRPLFPDEPPPPDGPSSPDGSSSPDGRPGLVRTETAADGLWTAPPRFPSGAGGLVSTLDDYRAFAEVLLGRTDLVSPEAHRLLTTDHLTPAQRAMGSLFLDGQGWGFGGSVDLGPGEPWQVAGRYGWVGGTGTAAHVVPSSGAVTILLTPVAMTGPVAPQVMRDFWTYAAG